MTKHVELIIRNNCNIKSRQWWLKYINKLHKILFNHLPKKKYKSIRGFGFTLLITNDLEIKRLNLKFRRINKPTDVLSFQLGKNEQLRNKYLGDIVISSQQAAKQAKEKHFPTESELLMLLTHGYLHLAGYDHMIKREAKQMFALQNKILLELLFY